MIEAWCIMLLRISLGGGRFRIGSTNKHEMIDVTNSNFAEMIEDLRLPRPESRSWTRLIRKVGHKKLAHQEYRVGQLRLFVEEMPNFYCPKYDGPFLLSTNKIIISCRP